VWTVDRSREQWPSAKKKGEVRRGEKPIARHTPLRHFLQRNSRTFWPFFPWQVDSAVVLARHRPALRGPVGLLQPERQSVVEEAGAASFAFTDGRGLFR